MGKTLQIRLSDEQYSQLRIRAGGVEVAAYCREVLFPPADGVLLAVVEKQTQQPKQPIACVPQNDNVSIARDFLKTRKPKKPALLCPRCSRIGVAIKSCEECKKVRAEA